MKLFPPQGRFGESAGSGLLQGQNKKGGDFLALELIQLRTDKEQAFARDFLSFASRKFNATAVMDWSVLVEHIADVRWIDLFDVARFTGQTASIWPTCDCWAMAWDTPIDDTWVHLKDPASRRLLAAAIGLCAFDPALATRAVRHDMMICVNDSYANFLAHVFDRADYSVYLISHELLHFVDDWTGKQRVQDTVPPTGDIVVEATLKEFVQKIGGIVALKQRYT